MSIRRAPACTGYLFRKIRIDTAHLISIDHLYIQSDISGTFRQPRQNLFMLLCLSQTQVSVLMILTVYLQLLRKRRPEIFNSVHDKRQFPRITSGLSYAASVSAGTSVSEMIRALQADDLCTAFCKVIADCTAYDTSTDYYYFCCIIHALHPPLPHLRKYASRLASWEPWMLQALILREICQAPWPQSPLPALHRSVPGRVPFRCGDICGSRSWSTCRRGPPGGSLLS